MGAGRGVARTGETDHDRHPPSALDPHRRRPRDRLEPPGIEQFRTTVFAPVEHFVAMGMTPEQATLYAGLPAWMDLAFGLGVVGGLVGSVLLLFGRREATPVLAVSLAAYFALYVGDITEGVFAALGMGQVVVLTVVVAIAAGLLALAVRAGRRAREGGAVVA
jgi:hypothetical protein